MISSCRSWAKRTAPTRRTTCRVLRGLHLPDPCLWFCSNQGVPAPTQDMSHPNLPLLSSSFSFSARFCRSRARRPSKTKRKIAKGCQVRDPLGLFFTPELVEPTPPTCHWNTWEPKMTPILGVQALTRLAEFQQTRAHSATET